MKQSILQKNIYEHFPSFAKIIFSNSPLEQTSSKKETCGFENASYFQYSRV